MYQEKNSEINPEKTSKRNPGEIPEEAPPEDLKVTWEEILKSNF